MRKKITWNTPKITSSVKSSNQHNSMKEVFAKGEREHLAQLKIQENLAKLRPVMNELLKIRMLNKSVLVVNRPFNYNSSELQKSKDYFGEMTSGSFRDVVKSIPIGTNLVFKALDEQLNQFIFENVNTGEEIDLGYIESDKLMTQTSIYEDSIKYLESLEEKE